MSDSVAVPCRTRDDSGGRRTRTPDRRLRTLTHDVAAWCGPVGHKLISSLSTADGLGFALAAALEGMRQLRGLGAKIYMCGPSMQHFRVKSGALIFDDLPLVEHVSFMPIMKEADVHIYA